MFSHNVLKYIACGVIVSYICVFNANSIFAANLRLVVNPHMFAQVSSPETVTAGEEKAFQQLYLNKISRLERDIAEMQMWRSGVLTASLTSLSTGTSVYFFGGSTVRDAIKAIPGDDIEFQEEKEDALKSLGYVDLLEPVGGIIAVSGGILLLWRYIVTKNINQKQGELDTLQSELDAYFETKGITPKYLQRSKSVASVEKEIDALKKKVRKARTIQSILGGLRVATIVSGLALVFASKISHDVVETIDINENNVAQVAAKNDALDETDKMKTAGIVFLGAAAASAIVSFVLDSQTRETDKRIDELEDSLLGIVERIDIQPKSNGFMITYTHRF